MITRQQIEQYVDWKREISMLEDQIYAAECAGELITDTVKGSMRELPYAVHKITVKGYASRRVPRLMELKTRLIAECAAVEGFIDGIEDSFIRQIFTQRYIAGKSLEETSQLVGYSERQIRRIINNFFEQMSADVR